MSEAPARGVSKVAVIVQARMTSTRLPGKVLLDLGPGTTLEILCRRLRRLQSTDAVAIATSTEPSDDPIAEAGLPFEVIRGPLHDVLERYRQAAEALSADAVVRVTSDCPLVVPSVIDRLVAMWRADEAVDYVSNIREPRTFPGGLDVEVVSRPALDAAAAESTEPYDREHVTPFVRDRRERFPQRDLRLEPPVRGVKLDIDTPEDLEAVRAFISRVGPDADLDAILAAAGGGPARLVEG